MPHEVTTRITMELPAHVNTDTVSLTEMRLLGVDQNNLHFNKRKPLMGKTLLHYTHSAKSPEV